MSECCARASRTESRARAPQAVPGGREAADPGLPPADASAAPDEALTRLLSAHGPAPLSPAALEALALPVRALGAMPVPVTLRGWLRPEDPAGFFPIIWTSCRETYAAATSSRSIVAFSPRELVAIVARAESFRGRWREVLLWALRKQRDPRVRVAGSDSAWPAGAGEVWWAGGRMEIQGGVVEGVQAHVVLPGVWEREGWSLGRLAVWARFGVEVVEVAGAEGPRESEAA